MRHFNYIYDQFIFYDYIDNAIDALPDSVTILTRKFYTTLGPGIDSKRIDT